MKNRFDKITDNDILTAYETARSVQHMCKMLGLPQNGNNQSFVTKSLQRLGLDRSVFKRRRFEEARTEKICPVCGKTFWVRHGDRKKTTCSHSCSNKYFRTKENNGQRKRTMKKVRNGEGLLPTAYKNLCFAYHKKECVVCGESKIVAVHHFNENHQDNSVENLVPLCPTHHQYMHSRYKNEIFDKVKAYVDDFRRVHHQM